jgi:hypothetical protein
VQLELANRPEPIRIHLALSGVCFSPLRFNSSGKFCDRSAISSGATPNPNPHHKRRHGSADRVIVFSSKNPGKPLPNQGRESCHSLAAANNGKRIDNGYCWIVYFKRNDPANSTIT